MTYGTYGPRTRVHRDRFGSRKTNGPNLWAILHTSEGGESSFSAEGLSSYMTQPGDRVSSSGTIYGSSYHVVFDTDRILPAVPYDTVAHSASGANAQGIHGCFPGRANQTREQWLDPVSRAMIRQCAAWLCDIRDEFGIPVDHLMSPNEMLAGDKGLGDHFTVTMAFGLTDHWDVGPNFPWDVLFADIHALTFPPPIVPPVTPPEGAPEMFIFVITNAPGSQHAETWTLCDGTQLSHIVDAHAAQVFNAVAEIVRSSSVEQTAGVIRSCRTMNDCPPEWVGSGWEALWNASRGPMDVPPDPS